MVAMMNNDQSLKREWSVMRCLNAYRDVHGNPGQHKVPLDGYDHPMTKDEALKRLAEVEQARPDEDFSIRRLAWISGESARDA